jgi:hypothetical protein
MPAEPFRTLKFALMGLAPAIQEEVTWCLKTSILALVRMDHGHKC